MRIGDREPRILGHMIWEGGWECIYLCSVGDLTLPYPTLPYLYSLLIYTLYYRFRFPARSDFEPLYHLCDPYRIWGPSLWRGPLSRVLGPLGCNLGGLGAVLAPRWWALGPSWLQDGGPWGHLGSRMGGLGAILAPG